MNPYVTYQRQTTPAWTRIDMLLALFDGSIDRCEQALAAIQRQDQHTAKNLLVKARLIVLGLASGVVPDGDPVTTTMLQLYEYAQHALGQGTVEDVRGALNVLRILREGFQKIRAEAIDLERRGLIPPISSSTSTVQMLA